MAVLCVGVSARYCARVLRATGSYVLAHVLFAAVSSASARAQGDTVVFVAPEELETEAKDALHDAIAAQVSLAGARLVFRAEADAQSWLEDDLARAKQLGRRENAVGVIWLDARPSGRWFLYIMEGSGEQIVVRPLLAASRSPEAAIEAVAVIVRSATEALIARDRLDERLGGTLVAEAEKPTDALRLDVGYGMGMFSPGFAWEHGFALGAAWLWPGGAYVGLHYVWFPAMQVDAAGLRFDVNRYPMSLRGGFRFELLPRLFLSAELQLGIEVRTRSTVDAIDALLKKPDSTKTVYLSGLGAVVEFAITDWLVLFARLGPELLFGNFDYRGGAQQSDVDNLLLLGPYRVRMTAQLGLAIIR